MKTWIILACALSFACSREADTAVLAGAKVKSEKDHLVVDCGKPVKVWRRADQSLYAKVNGGGRVENIALTIDEDGSPLGSARLFDPASDQGSYFDLRIARDNGTPIGFLSIFRLGGRLIKAVRYCQMDDLRISENGGSAPGQEDPAASGAPGVAQNDPTAVP